MCKTVLYNFTISIIYYPHFYTCTDIALYDKHTHSILQIICTVYKPDFVQSLYYKCVQMNFFKLKNNHYYGVNYCWHTISWFSSKWCFLTLKLWFANSNNLHATVISKYINSSFSWSGYIKDFTVFMFDLRLMSDILTLFFAPNILQTLL